MTKIDTTKTTRVEVIDHSGRGESFGRVYTNYDIANIIEAHLQDDGRTLKIFIN